MAKKPAIIKEIERLDAQIDRSQGERVVPFDLAKVIRRKRTMVQEASRIWTGATNNTSTA